MKKRLWLGLSTVLAVLVGCGDDTDTDTEPVAEYGMPMAHYDLSGRVLQDGTETGIEGMEVDFHGEEATTAADGSWSLSADTWSCDTACSITARDVDGDTHGAWQEATVDFTPTQVEEGDGGWDEGTWEASVDIEVIEDLAGS